MDSEPDTLIVCSCDRNYFPLLKGLVLSIVDRGPLPDGIGIAFLDIGCDADDLAWLAERGVRIRELREEIMGRLAHPSLGYQRTQVCRPFLPQLFPGKRNFIWIDSDAWVQDASIFACLRSALATSAEQLFIAPECHYSYGGINDRCAERRAELLSYYEPVCGATIGAQLSEQPVLNSGFFAMAACNPLWDEWKRAVRRFFLEDARRYPPIVRHMSEQAALNVIARRSGNVTLIDPLYNYVCLWTPPVRDAHGIVRIALPPHLPVGIIHLAGGWKEFGHKYAGAGLLYQEGSYLTEAEKSILFPAKWAAGFR